MLALLSLVCRMIRGTPFLFSEEFTGDADAFFRVCADHQLEGIVSKLAS
jgi:ATP-dependent DNA ligase